MSGVRPDMIEMAKRVSPETTIKQRGKERGGYAGDVDPSAAWDMISNDSSAVLVDVRTRAEWGFVGVPDLSSLGNQVLFIPWQEFPEMEINPRFIDSLKAEGPGSDAPLLFLCRSGARSRAAAIAAAEHGFSRCFNVAEGFEGDLNTTHHRGRVNGWKARGLPWEQQ